MSLILTIDSGTQSVRCAVFDLHGQLRAMARTPGHAPSVQQGGWVQQEAEDFWQALAQNCQRLWQTADLDRSQIQAVALTTQRSTIVAVDAAGRPLYPAIGWLDQRRCASIPSLGAITEGALRLLGLRRFVSRLQNHCKAHWLQQQHPDLWQKTDKYLLLSGFLTHRLTGRFVDSVGHQVGYLPFDVSHRCWPGPKNFRYRLFQIERDKLPELLEPTVPLGTITPDAAAATGIPAGLPLIAAASDQACEVLGTGCLEPGVASLGLGTTATVKTPLAKYTEIFLGIPPYTSAMPKTFYAEMQIFCGLWMITWFKEQLAREYQDGESSVEEQLEREAATIAAGSEGLLLQPYWCPGVCFPGEEARGSIVGFRLHHTRAHLYRALLEGLAFGLRAGAERISRKVHLPFGELRLAGGGAQSPLLTQILADVFNLPVRRPQVLEASCLGAAIDAAVGLGVYRDFPTAVKAMVHLGEPVFPHPPAVALYEQLYCRVYQNLYPRLRQIYYRLQEIFGA